MESCQPLVTVCVITYNSSKFVTETLDSIYQQTYPNIELIISDDASTDNTVELCRDWIQSHIARFQRFEILTVPVNTGISPNCNRGLKASKGEWFKLIAGDDMLVVTAIEDYVEFCKKDDNISAVISDCCTFVKTRNGEVRQSYLKTPHPILSFNKYSSAKWQYWVSSRTLLGYGACTFIQTQTLISIGGYDERFPMQEDHVIFIKIAKSGRKWYYMPKAEVLYRINETSVTHTKEVSSFYSPSSIRILTQYQPQYIKENVGVIWCVLYSISLFLTKKVINSGNNREIWKSCVWHFIQKSFDPIWWERRIVIGIENVLSRLPIRWF